MAQVRAEPYLADDLVDRSRITAPRSLPLARPALQARLEEGVRHGFVLVSAPAGWGKSSLLTAWSQETALPVAWLSLTPRENDPVQFMRALAIAIDIGVSARLDDVQAMLRSAEPLPVAAVATVLLESVRDAGREIAVVLDDFHVIDDPGILTAVERIIFSPASALRLIIATRTDPPWPLARLRASGALGEIRASDLRLTAPEAQAMLQDVALPDAAIATLVERTEGWAAGVRLAALAAARHANPELMLANLRGTNRDIADYLVEQVLASQPDEVREFLLATSILDQLSGPLCDALLERSGGQEMLEYLEAANLFLIPLDDERRWYRYHGLFSDVLRAQLEREDAGRMAGLHRRAAAWFAHQRPMVSQAVEHLIAARAWRDVATTIDESGELFLFYCGEAAVLVRWVEALPREILADYPRLLRYFAWGLTLTGRLEDAETLLVEAAGLCGEGDTDHKRHLRAEVAAIRSRLASYRGEYELTIAAGNEALALIGETRDRIAGDVSVSLGFAYRALGETEAAAAAFARGSEVGWSTGNLQAALWGTRYLALMRVIQGRLDDAEAILEDEFDRLAREGIGPGPAFASLLVGRAELRYERDDLNGALADLEQALALALPAGDAKILMTIYVIMALVHQALGRNAAAVATARRGQQVFGERMPLAIPARIALLQGNLAAADRWATAIGFQPDDLPDPAKGESEQITFGRVLLARGETGAGLAYLQRLLDAADAGGRTGNAIELLVILAAARERAGERAEAVTLLSRALRLAAPEGYVRTFADEGADLIPLLRATLRERDGAIPFDYVHRLCRAIERDVIGNSAMAEVAALVEPLTERELEVLRLVADGLPNRAIAAALFLAEGTVKAHVNHINGKLLARNRTEAVAQARRLQLI